MSNKQAPLTKELSNDQMMELAILELNEQLRYKRRRKHK